MENTVEINEIEEIENIEQDDVIASEENNNSAFAAGILGGLLAYAIISVGKRLGEFVGSKIVEHREKNRCKDESVYVSYSDIMNGQESDEDAK